MGENQSNIHYYYRTVKDLRGNKILDFDDPENILDCLNENVRKTFLSNPSTLKDDDVCQIIALDGNKVVGSEMCFANRYLDGNDIHECYGHSTLFVSEPYRKLMVGADLMLQAASFRERQDNIVAGISQIAYPIYKAMRYGCFSFPRFIVLMKSRCVVESMFKSLGKSAILISKPIDLCLWLYRKAICQLVPNKQYKIEKVQATPIEVEEIVLQDDHRFKELHDKKWFDWCLSYSFTANPENSKYLNLVKENNKIIAFYVVKVDFFAEVGSSSYKNIRLATIAEWGIKKGCSLTESQLHLLALKNIKENVDGVQIATTDNRVEKKYRKYCFFPMGIVNNAVYMNSIKDDEVKKKHNWRLRIAAGDTLIN